MKRIVSFIGITTGLLFLFYFLFSSFTKKSALTAPIPATAIPTINIREASESAEKSATKSAVFQKPVHLLLLGFDARRGDKNPRCDAIHILSFLPDENKILITSIPRGTTVEMPNTSSPSAYLGNSCHVMGLDFAISKIEKIAKIHPDYLVKLNFSQTLGILRLLQLPTSPTLQFLRNRRYGIGDNQRSHNQALFIKDIIVNHLEQFAKLPKPLKRLLFSMVDTNLNFETADELINQIAASYVYKNPTQIELVARPTADYRIKEIHYFEDEFQNQADWQNDTEFKDYQAGMENYLQNLIERADKYLADKRESSAYQILKTPFLQQLWLQIEDEQKRNQYHFELLRIFVLSSPDKEESAKLVRDFITEMEVLKQDELKKEAEKLIPL